MNPLSAADAANLAYRVGELEKDVNDLALKFDRDVGVVSRKVDRLMWAVLSLALSITASAVVFAITVATIRGGP